MTKQREITQEQFKEWRDHPVTQSLFDQFQVDFEVARLNLVNKKGNIQERGESSLINGTLADAFYDLYSMTEDYLNTPIDMEGADGI